MNKSYLWCVVSVAAGLLIGFVVWGRVDEVDSPKGQNGIEIPDLENKAAHITHSGPPVQMVYPSGFALLFIGGGSFLEGYWDGDGRFVVTRWRSIDQIGSGSYAILDARNVKQLDWHDGVSFLTREDSGKAINRLLQDAGR